MQRQLDDVKKTMLDLGGKLAEATSSLARKVAHRGRRVEMALASALSCSDGQRASENKSAAREAITSEWPRAMAFAERWGPLGSYVAAAGVEQEYSRAEPAGDADRARMPIATLRSKIGRDGFLA
eukprot:15448147-Alexandrium_andersonii.AAC.1